MAINRKFRNAPCPCGSGLRFKHCHGHPNQQYPPAELVAAVKEAERLNEAAELVRQYQQGFGKPIISVEQKGYRIVAVANRVKWSRGWLWFTDFLLDHLKDSIGREWGTQAVRDSLQHPLFRWLRRMNEYMQSQQVTGLNSFRSEEIGFLTSVFRLGYALYLIDHHDQLDPTLIKRLRSTSQFRAAYYETLIAAAFAVSGAKINMAEHAHLSETVPEFWATGKSQRRYAVEAKCKDAWRCTPDPAATDFKGELRQWIRDKIYRASKKKLKDAVYCFELSIPNELDVDQWKAVQATVKEALAEAEGITVKGVPALPAYVIVTNHGHLVNDDAKGLTTVAMLHGFRLENLVDGVELPLETAMEWHDAHRDIHWVLKCMEEIQRIPATFDGTPAEFAWAEHEGRRVLRIGQALEINFPDGPDLRGILRDVCSHGSEAHVVIETVDGQHHIASIPLTPEEAEAARMYGDAVFGKPEKRRKNLGDDPLALYDWFLEVYSRYDRDALLRQIEGHFLLEEISKLPLEELLVRVAREVTKAAVNQAQRSEKAAA